MRNTILALTFLAGGVTAAEVPNAMYITAKDRQFHAILMPDHGSYSIDRAAYIECPQGVQVDHDGNVLMVYQCNDMRTLVVTAPADPKVAAEVTILDHVQRKIFESPIISVREVK